MAGHRLRGSSFNLPSGKKRCLISGAETSFAVSVLWAGRGVGCRLHCLCCPEAGAMAKACSQSRQVPQGRIP